MYVRVCVCVFVYVCIYNRNGFKESYNLFNGRGQNLYYYIDPGFKF